MGGGGITPIVAAAAGILLKGQDEGVSIGSNFKTINAIGDNIYAEADGNILNIYSPAPSYSDYFNQGAADVSNITTSNKYIAEPTTEGSPFSIGSWSGGELHWSTNNSSLIFSTTTTFSIESLITTLTAEIFGADNVTELAPYLQITIGSDLDSGWVNGIRIVISGFVAENSKYAADATIYYDMATILGGSSGRFNVKITHNNGISGIFIKTQNEIFYDSEPLTMIVSGVTIAENTPVFKYISGIKYYDLNSSFDLAVSDIDNKNADSWPADQLRINGSEYGIPSYDEAYSNITGHTAAHNNTNSSYAAIGSVTDDDYRYFGNTANLKATPLDWSAGTMVPSANDSILVDTHGTTSTNLIRYFDDESLRLQSDYSTSWDSTVALSADEALMMNSKIMVPNRSRLTGESTALNSNWTTYNPDLTRNYSSLGLGSGVSYFMKVDDTSGIFKTGFILTFAGSFVTDATVDLANEDLKIFVRKYAGSLGDTGTGANPLLLHGSEYNFVQFTDGDDGNPGSGNIREGSSSGNVVNSTFGSWQCRFGCFVEIMINNIAIEIDSIQFTFI